MAQACTQHGGQDGVDKEGIQLLHGFLFIQEDPFHDEPSQGKSYDPKEVVIFDLNKTDVEQRFIGIPGNA
jgi:hypothetical protein